MEVNWSIIISPLQSQKTVSALIIIIKTKKNTASARIASAPLGAPANKLFKYNNYRKDKSPSACEHAQANASSPTGISVATNSNVTSPRGDTAGGRFARKYVDC